MTQVPTQRESSPVEGALVAPLPRRPLWSRLSLGHVIMVLAGLLAFLLTLAVLRDQSATAFVAVAATDIEAGTRLVAADVEFVEINAEDDAIFASIMDDAAVQAELDARAIATRTITAGDLLLQSDFRAVDPLGVGRRAESIEIDPGRAVGGTLAVGDLVDIIEVDGDESASFVATGVEVIAIARPEAASLGGSAQITVTVSVDAPTSLALSFALANNEVFLVRATGADPADPAAGFVPSPPTTLPVEGG